MKAIADSFIARERGILATKSPSTVDLYETRLVKHVLPMIGTRKADELTVQHIRSLIDKLTAAGHSGSSLRGCLTALSAAFRHGERDLGAVRRNPVRDLDRGDRPSGKRESEPRYLSVMEVDTLLSKMTNEMMPIASALFYGALRVSEALAIVWADVEFDTSTLIVRGTKTRHRGRRSRCCRRSLPSCALTASDRRARALPGSGPTRSSFRPSTASRYIAATSSAPSRTPPTRPD